MRLQDGAASCDKSIKFQRHRVQPPLLSIAETGRMDPLSTVLSAVPLAIQLAKGIHKLYVQDLIVSTLLRGNLTQIISDFLQSIQAAPAEIKWIIEDLHVLENVLNESKLSNDLHGPQPEMEQVLYRCIELLKEFSDAVKPFTAGLASSSRMTLKWTAMEVVWKSERIKQFRDRLAEAKINLLITQNLSTR